MDVEYANPKMLYAYPYNEEILPEEIQKVVTNHPSYLEGGTKILTTPVFAWNDLNGDGSPGGNEQFQRFTIMASENVSGGQVIVLSDTGMLLNAMQEGIPLQDNPHLFAWMGANTTLFYDTCYSEPFQGHGFSGVVSVMKNRTVIKIVTVFLIICGICAACIWVDRKNRQERLKSPPETPQENKKL